VEVLETITCVWEVWVFSETRLENMEGREINIGVRSECKVQERGTKHNQPGISDRPTIFFPLLSATAKLHGHNKRSF